MRKKENKGYNLILFLFLLFKFLVFIFIRKIAQDFSLINKRECDKFLKIYYLIIMVI